MGLGGREAVEQASADGGGDAGGETGKRGTGDTLSSRNWVGGGVTVSSLGFGAGDTSTAWWWAFAFRTRNALGMVSEFKCQNPGLNTRLNLNTAAWAMLGSGCGTVLTHKALSSECRLLTRNTLVI